MATIRSINVTIHTGDVDNAGTDGDVYFGICGREFHLNSGADDFERGSRRRYRLGDGANIQDSATNDPRNPPLDSDNLRIFPVYIRFEPSGSSPDWNLTFVNVEVAGTGFGVILRPGLWLGRTSGKICHLREGRFGE